MFFSTKNVGPFFLSMKSLSSALNFVGRDSYLNSFTEFQNTFD